MKTILFLTLGLLAATLIFPVQAEPEFTQPGWFRSVERERQTSLNKWNAASLVEDDGGSGFGIRSLVSYPVIAEAITPEIEALARGLETDPRQIFAYVRDNIRYVHYFGSKKGAQLTLLERSGNDFDQCALLVALLRAAGHTASYRFGPVVMPYESTNHMDFKHWLGLSKPNTNWIKTIIYTSNLNGSRGFPLTAEVQQETNDFVMHRVWVQLTWNGTVYSLDPAFKVYEPMEGINLATAIGLNTNELMTAAGGTSNNDYVQNMSETNLRKKLCDYTTNFLNHIQTNWTNASVKQILGGQLFSNGQAFGENLPFTPCSLDNISTSDWDNIPTNMMATLNITVDATTNRFLYMPQLQGQKLALTFNASGLGQLWLEDELLLEKQTSGGSTINVGVAVDHPHGPWDLTNNHLITTNWNDHAVTVAYQRTNSNYAITYAFEPNHDWLRQRQERLDQYRRQGLADTSREVTTETLNIMGLNWLLQTERIFQVLTAQQDILSQHHHRLGRMAQEAGKGYYIDVYQQLNGMYSASGCSTNDWARVERLFDLESYFASAAEHGLIEQMQSSDLSAASSIKMLQIGNTNGQRTYLAKSSNWSTVQGNLSNYNLNFLKTNYIDRGYSLLLPANGSNYLAGTNSWAGYGMVARGVEGVHAAMAMIISGGYHGGYVSDPYVVVDTPYVYQSSYDQPIYFDPVPLTVITPYGADPVSMADGSFHLTTTDLSIGQTEPRGLTLTRHYSSSRRFHNLAGIAPGWVHSFYSKASDVSAPLPGLGDTTPAQMAPMIVATRSAMELYSTNATPKNWAVSALIAKWGMDQLINNGVSVSLGKDTIQFIKQPNGTFTPPAGSTMTLLRTNNTYWLRQRHGNTFKFNGAGWLTNITDQYNKTLAVTYNASNWVASVKDWKNRQFTFNYSGNPLRLTSVTDDTLPSRTVSYGYTGSGNQFDLTSVTNVEGKTSTLLYDTNHQIIATKDALNRTVVSNAYDGFGRVIEQYSKGDTNQTWRLYWSGYRNIEVDPAGGRKQYFYDDKHRLNYTSDAMGHYTGTYYDGQDHVIITLTDMWNRTDFSYDGRHNLTAIQDPLNGRKDFYYDKNDNLVRVWDERGNNSYFGYNDKFQMTSSTNNAGDWTTFAFNNDGNPISRTDVGGTTSYGYDDKGQLNKITYPGGLGEESLVNNSRGDVISRVNPRGFSTTFQYNNRRELTNTIAPTNLTTRVAFDAVGNIHSTTDARGFTRSNTWSATQKLLTSTLPNGATTTNSYDLRDWLMRTVNPLQQATLYTNDAAGRLISVTDPLLRTTKFGYDGDNRKIAITNAADEVTWQDWNARSELIQVTDPANRIVRRAYDAAGNQITLTNRNGKKWQFQFDAANRLTNTISPLGKWTSQTWNERGLLASVKEPSGDTAALSYDAKGRLINRTDSMGAIIYRYDANDNQTSVVANGKTNAWTFDAYDRVSSYCDADGNLLQYLYDANGNLTSLIYPGNRVVSYAYDSQNCLTNVSDWAGRQTHFTYNLANQLTSITRPNGTVREMLYDAAGQIINIVERTSAGDPIAFFKFNWNNAGRMESEFTAPLLQHFTPPVRTMTYNDDNQIATFNGNGVNYDVDGNLTNGPLTNNTFVSYTYDGRNRLLNAGELSYGYDPSANRVAITSGTNVANVTRFVVNPNAALSQVLIRTRPDGSKTFYVHGVGLLYEVNETGGAETGTATYHYDYRGSTVALTDGDGNVTDRIEYSPYGMTTCRTGANDTPFLFNGRYGVQTDANGLLYMRARYYNPYLCRFLNPDPVGFAGGLNFYAYADGNPVSLIDPFGLSAVGDYFYDVGQVFVGYGQAIGDTAMGLYNGVYHWDDTLAGLCNIVTHPVQAYDAISQNVADTWNSGLQGQGRIVGDILITAATIGTGYVKGAQAAGTAGRGLEFSHWVPSRARGPVSIWNGNYVPIATHALSDPLRHRFMSKAWKAENPTPNALWQQWTRVPNVYKGIGAATAVSGAAHVGQIGTWEDNSLFNNYSGIK